MKGKTLVILVVAAAVLGGLAVLTSQRKNRPMPAAVGQALLPDLALDKVARAIIVADGKTSTVARVEDAWGVVERHNYPADFEKLKRALVKLADLKIGQTVQVGDAQKADLRVTPETAAQLVLQDQSGATLATLLLGETRESQSAMPGRGGYPDGRFVSRDGGATVYLVADTLDDLASAEPGRWVDSEIASLTGSDIASIRVTGPNREPIELKRGDDDKLTLQNLAEGEEFDSSKTYALESALSYLRFEDIADPALDEAALGLEAPIVYEAKTKSGLLYVATLGGKVADGENRYARFRVTYADDGKPAPEDETDEARQAREADAAKVRESAAAQNARLAKWTYVIPSYKADAIAKPRSDLLKTKTDDAAAATNGAPPSVTSPAPDAAAAPADKSGAAKATPTGKSQTDATGDETAANK
jgi:hypothetical protein